MMIHLVAQMPLLTALIYLVRLINNGYDRIIPVNSGLKQQAHLINPD
jgi:hypothetical protein